MSSNKKAQQGAPSPLCDDDLVGSLGRNMTLSFVIFVIFRQIRICLDTLSRMLLIIGIGLVEDVLILVFLDPTTLSPL